jgi:hypothetical protein
MEIDDRLAKVIWASGFIDGEGSIGVHVIRTGPYKHPYHILTLQVDQVDPRPLLVLIQLWGGSLVLQPRKTDRHAPIYHWTIGNKKAAKVCAEILPYLVNKREVAELGVRFGALVKDHGSPGGRVGKPNVSLTPEELEERDEIAQAFKQLNRRGVPRGETEVVLHKSRPKARPQLRLLEEVS